MNTSANSSNGIYTSTSRYQSRGLKNESYQPLLSLSPTIFVHITKKNAQQQGCAFFLTPLGLYSGHGRNAGGSILQSFAAGMPEAQSCNLLQQECMVAQSCRRFRLY
jgi:hypothetical protein